MMRCMMQEIPAGLYRENELNDIAKSVECISSYMEHEEEVHTAMGDIFDFSLLDIKYA